VKVKSIMILGFWCMDERWTSQWKVARVAKISKRTRTCTAGTERAFERLFLTETIVFLHCFSLRVQPFVNSCFELLSLYPAAPIVLDLIVIL
jgi:hypothetical protein